MVTRKEYKDLFGEYRALSSMIWREDKEKRENRVRAAAYARMGKIIDELGFNVYCNHSYISKDLMGWDVLKYSKQHSTRKNRVDANPKPNLP
jgi:hypothetical protein